MSQTRALSDLLPGETATVSSLSGLRPFRRRLMELGILPGTRVRMINRAPLGDPLEIEVRGCRLSIRASEAASIALSAAPETQAKPAGETGRRHLRVMP